MSSPCDECKKKCFYNGTSVEGTSSDCAEWERWFLSAWEKINNYANAHREEVDRIIREYGRSNENAYQECNGG